MSIPFETTPQLIDSDEEMTITLTRGYIYEIANPCTNKIYIGSSFTPSARFSKHRADYRLYQKTGILVSSSGLIFEMSDDISDTKMTIIDTVWVSNKKELEKIEKKHILANRDFCVNRNLIKTDEEKQKELKEKMRYLMRKRYENIEVVTCPCCRSKVKKHRLSAHKSTKLCNRRSEKLVDDDIIIE